LDRFLYGLAEAIRFAIEGLPSNVLGGCSLEVAEDRYVGSAIRGPYEKRGFSLAAAREIFREAVKVG
jgi:hypothetical protein